MNSILQLIEERIQHFKEKRENLKQVKGTHDERHYVQGKLNELQYLKKKIKNNKFLSKCPHCDSVLAILSTNIDIPNKTNLPASRSPICWPYSLSEDSSKIDSFQRIIIQAKCTACGKYYNVHYRFEDIKEVTDEAGIWYDDSEHVGNWRRNKLNTSEDIRCRTRRSILEVIKGLFKKTLK